LRSPATLSLGGLRRTLLVSAALGALGALVWGPLVVEALAQAHPSVGRLLPAGDTGRVYTALAVAVPLLLAAALQVSAARRVPTHTPATTLAEYAAAAGRPPGSTLRWALPLVALGALLVALNLGALGLLLVCAFLAGAGSVAFLVAYLTMGETLARHGVGGLWEGLATIWDYASATRHLFSAELHLLDGTLLDPIWGALAVFVLLYVAPTALAVWTLRRAPTDVARTRPAP